MYLDPYRFKKSFVDTTDTRQFPDGEVVHERFDRLRLEVQLELTIWLVLQKREIGLSLHG